MSRGRVAAPPEQALELELHDSLAIVLREAVIDSAFPGAYVVVGGSRGVIAEHGEGRLDWAASPRPTARTLWDLASLTKVIATTTALAQLVESGRVQLDAPVLRYVPEWTGPDKEKVTVRQLLTHTSGLPAFREYDRQTHDPDSLASLLFETELERAPGEQMVYSDIGAFMMGRVIENVSGQHLDAYVREHITGPLDMKETMFNPPDSVHARVAPTEIDTTRGGLVRAFVHDERAHYLGGVAAHAGLFSTAHDVERFARMLLNGGMLDSARILGPGTIAALTAYADSNVSNRALGWQKPERPGMRDRTPGSSWAGRFMGNRAFGHTGFTGTSIAIDPELDLYIILLSNRVNPTRRNPRISDVRARLADAVVAVVRARRDPNFNVEVP